MSQSSLVRLWLSSLTKAHPSGADRAQARRAARRRRTRRGLAIGGPYAERLEVRLLPSNVLTVDSTVDTTDAGTLRWAIGQANAMGGEQTIQFGFIGFVHCCGSALSRYFSVSGIVTM